MTGLVSPRVVLVRAAVNQRQKLWAQAMFRATDGAGWRDRLRPWEKEALSGALEMADKEVERWRNLTQSLDAELADVEAERDAALAKLKQWSKDRESPA